MTATATRSEAIGQIEAEFGVLLRRLKRVVGERARAVHPDLQGASYILLGWLSEHPPVRASAIVEQFGMDKGSLSRQLQHLEDLGLVERTPDPADGRATLVATSAEAVRRLAQVDEDRRRALDAGLADWSVAELEEFARQLGHYNRSLE